MNYKNTIHTVIASLACSPFTYGHGEPADHHPEDHGVTTVIGRRAPQVIEGATSKLHLLDAGTLRNIGINNVTNALETLPGVNISSASQSGTGQGVRIRGLRPQDTQFRIDGVRFTRRQGNLDSFAGQASLLGISRVELLKGSQSSLYGSSANGGVVNLQTKFGGEITKRTLTAEAGSFNSLSLENEHSGITDRLSYFYGTSFSTTDNDTYGDNSEALGFDNDYVSYQSALRLGYNISDDFNLGLTFRGSNSSVDTPQFGGSNVESQFYLGTLFANYRVSENWVSKLTLSALVENSYFNSAFSNNKTDYNQFGISWENTLQYSGSSSINFGAEYEHQDYTGFGALNGETDHYLAAYLNHAIDLRDITLEAGIRYEDYRSFGNHISWRTGAKYNIEQTNTTLKASVATGFNAPTITQLYSPFSFGIQGNPDLSPETTLGWDITLEQQLHDDHSLNISLFETDIDDAIVRDFAAGEFVNASGKNKASGIEASLKGTLSELIHYQVNYTWLDRSFNGQPQQAANAIIKFTPNEKTTFGIGAQYLDQRSYGGNVLEDAFILRAFGSYQLNDHIKLHARVENITDTEYSHVDFSSSFGAGDFPARRLGAHAGVTIEW